MLASTRTVFYVSDGTGFTAETLGHCLLAQFEGCRFRQVKLGRVESFANLYVCVDQIRSAREVDGAPPLVFSTLVRPDWAQALQASDCVFFDLFDSFLDPMEAALGRRSSRKVRDPKVRGERARMDAINFALAHDDGASNLRLEEADLVLVGVSRSGKTPTCLYLAMQHGVKAANYPLIPEDFDRGHLPPALLPVRAKLFGLSLTPQRLCEVRQQRRPGSDYASRANCEDEIAAATRMMQREGIRCFDSSAHSVEELANAILQGCGLERCAA